MSAGKLSLDIKSSDAFFGAARSHGLSVAHRLCRCPSDNWVMEPLQATIEEFAAAGYTHVECHCPRCRVTRLRSMNWLPRITMGLTIAHLSERLRCAECGGPVQ